MLRPPETCGFQKRSDAYTGDVTWVEIDFATDRTRKGMGTKRQKAEIISKP
jgi:hypothetical protein